MAETSSDPLIPSGPPVSSDPPPRPAWPFWAGLLAVFGVGAFYVGLPLANFTDAKDSLRYASRIAAGDPLFHPNHLLYEPVVYVVHRLTNLVAGPVAALDVMRWVSILSALPFLYCAYLLVWRAARAAAVAALAVAAVGFCFGVWVYAVSPDGYLPPLLFALVSLCLLDPAGGGGLPSMRRTIVAALAVAAAVLLHQMYVVFALICGFVLLFRAEFGPLAQRARLFAAYGGVSGGLVLIIYVVVHAALGQDAPLIDWARGFAKDTLTYGGPPSLLTPVKGAIGAVSTMLTMNGLMAFDMIAERLSAAFAGKSLLEERYIAEVGIASWAKLPILLAMPAACALWLAMAVAAVRVPAARPAGYVDRVLLIAVLVYAVLVMIWEPTNREFWIQTYVFATLWCLRQFPQMTRRVAGVAGGLVLCLFVVNFLAALRPLSDPRSDYWRAYNAAALAQRGSVDLVVSDCSWLCMWYLRYFGEVETLSPRRVSPEDLAAKIAATGSGRVLVSSLVYAPHSLSGEYNKRIIEPAWGEAFRAAYPPPGPLPEDDSRQVFFRLVEGRLIPLE